ncbi:MAG: phage tail protein [Alphaproteobacteria bacterium]|nr:phage tail protein [Alphaproteobacteria bacterium]
MKYEPIDKQIKNLIESINAMPEQVAQASIFALNRVAEWLKGRVSQEVSKEKRIKLKLIRDRISIMRANKKKTEAALNCNFRGILVKDLASVRQTATGVTAGGASYPHAFIATLKPGGKPGVYRRTSKKRFPVRSVRIEIYDEAEKIITELLGKEARDVFEKRFLHEIQRMTGALA